MNNDEFYDSLEEDGFSSTSDGDSISPEKPSSSGVFASIESQPSQVSNTDISTLVPLYSGETAKCEITSNVRKSSSIPHILKSTKNCNQITNEHQKKCKHTKNPFVNLPQKRSKIGGSSLNFNAAVKVAPERSYLGIFYSRIGYRQEGNNNEEIEDSVRSIFGDSERSMPSDPSSTDNEQFQDAEGYESDCTSFYLEQIQRSPEEDNRQIKASCITLTSLVSSSSPLSKFKSISEVITSNRSTITNKSQKTKIPPVPVLGGLGPNTNSLQAKLERRRKQLNYGQRASDRNRIKLMEIKVLRNLKLEIEDSKETNKLLNNSHRKLKE